MPRSALVFAAHSPRRRASRLVSDMARPNCGRLEREWWHQTVRKSFEGLGEIDNFDDFFDELFGYFGDPANWVPLPETHTVLQRLKDTELKLGIISNFDYRLYRILEGLELRPFFDKVTISSEAGFAKPAREIFTAALSAMGLE